MISKNSTTSSIQHYRNNLTTTISTQNQNQSQTSQFNRSQNYNKTSIKINEVDGNLKSYYQNQQQEEIYQTSQDKFGSQYSKINPSISYLKKDQQDQSQKSQNKYQDTQSTYSQYQDKNSCESLEVKMNKLDLKTVKAYRGLTGLTNIGNTCFLNSVLQCLFNCSCFADYFLNYNYKSDLKPTHKNVAVEFADLLNKVRASNNSYGESTMNLKRSFGKVSPQFTGYDQEDVIMMSIFFFKIYFSDNNYIL